MMPDFDDLAKGGDHLHCSHELTTLTPRVHKAADMYTDNGHIHGSIRTFWSFTNTETMCALSIGSKITARTV